MVLKECLACEESMMDLLRELRRSSSKCFTSGLDTAVGNKGERERERSNPERKLNQ